MPDHVGRTTSHLVPRDKSVDPVDVPRLSGQNLAILDLLQKGREVSNFELATISLKYTSRLSDLRKAGHVVDARRGDDGTWWYTLG